MTLGLEVETKIKYLQLYKGRTSVSPLDPVLPQRVLGSFLASCGLVAGDKQGPLATNSEKNLVGREAARPGPRTLPRKQVGHILLVPTLSTCPKSWLPSREDASQPVSASGSCHFYSPWTNSESSSPQ